MQPFAGLVERLRYAPERAQPALIVDYLRTAPDPDRGWGVGLLAGALEQRRAGASLIRGLLAARADPVLVGWSRAVVGDLAETLALLWRCPAEGRAPPRLAAVVEALATVPKDALPGLVAGWLDALDATGRHVLLGLVTGRLGLDLPPRLVRLALARHGGVALAEVEAVWHGQEPPYAALLAWLDGKAPRPRPTGAAGPAFRPMTPVPLLTDADRARLAAERFQATWLTGGPRVQLAADGATARLFTPAGDDLARDFPDLVAAARFAAVLEGELAAPDGPAAPARLRLHDLLAEGGTDLRALPSTRRRQRLEALLARERPAGMEVAPLLPAASLAELDRLRRGAGGAAGEALLLKRWDSPYAAEGDGWWTWPREPELADLVLLYACRGPHAAVAELTLGAWRPGASGGDELVPVGRVAAEGETADLQALARWVRDHTLHRHGPVRAVTPGLVLEVAFAAVRRSSRHKAGLVLHRPRLRRVRWDRSAAAAHRLEALARLIG